MFTFDLDLQVTSRYTGLLKADSVFGAGQVFFI